MQLSSSTKNRLLRKYGDWALITGATSGIGKELAIQLARAGLNVAITGRRAGLLEAMSRALSTQYGVQVAAFPGDLSRQSEVEQLIESLAGYELGLAIMNAGYGTSGCLLQSDLEKELNMLDLNSRAVLILTHHFSRYFAQKRRGGVILMSSIVGFQGVPNAANYSATKAYIQSFGEALALELKPHGVDVLCAAPGPVKSGFSKRADMRMGKALKPEDVGVPILKALGKKTTVFPGLLTKVLVYSLKIAPRWGKVRIMKEVMGGMTKHQSLPEFSSTK